MSEMVPSGGRSAAPLGGGGSLAGQGDGGGNLADVLERVLDKGVVIVGDIRVNLLDIELLTIRLRLLVAGVDTARRIGIDWWEHDPWLSGGAESEERERIEQRLDRIERRLGAGDAAGGDAAASLADEAGGGGDAAASPELERENEDLRAEVERLRRRLSGRSARRDDG